MNARLAILSVLLLGSSLWAGVDLDFANDRAWQNDVAQWSGKIAGWTQEQFRTVQGFVATKADSEIARALPPGDGELNLAVEYAWRQGRLEGIAHLALIEQPTNRRVVVRLAQAIPGKHRVTWQVPGAEPRVLGELKRDALDCGFTTGGLPDEPAALHLRLTNRSLRLARVDTPVPPVTLDLPEDFSPTHVAFVADTEPELFTLRRLRAFRESVDPSADLLPLSVPFGGMFVEGQPIRLGISARWYTDEPREASLELTLKRQLPDEANLPRLSLRQALSPCKVSEVDTSSWGKLPPGLYEVNGMLTVGKQTRGVSARFAVVSAELASRPRERIPRWVGIMPFINLLPRDRFEPAFELLSLLGVRHVRWLPGWGRIEPEEGRIDWSESDLFVRLCQQHDIEAMFCLSYYGPEWTVRKSNGQRAHTSEGRALWVERFAVPVIQRYGNVVKLYQIWNEPDAFWDDDPAKAKGFAVHFGSPANYFDLLRRTHAAAHALGIDGVKVMASLSSGEQVRNINRLFDMGLAEFFDGIVLHTYGNHYRHLERARKLLADKGFPDATIVCGEFGIPTPKNPASERLQASRVATFLLSTACHENIRGVNWFVLTRIAHPMFGLIDEQFQPQPGTVAFFTVARLLSGATRGTMTESANVRTFRVERDGLPPLVAVVVSRPTSLEFRVVGDAKPVVWNLWGGRSDPTLNDGQFSMETPDVVLVEGDVQLESLLVADLAPAMREGKPIVRVVPGGVFKPESPASVTLRVPALQVDVKRSFDSVKEMQLADLELPAAEPARVYPAELELTIDGQTVRIETSVEFTPAVRVSDAEAESLDAPRDAVRIRLVGQEMFQSLGHGRYEGPQDNAAEIAFGYTDRELILWVKQTDDIHMPVQMPNPWGFDGPQWAIAPSVASDAVAVEITFGIGNDGERFARVVGQPHYKPTLLADRSGTTTRYRVAIPFSQIDIEPRLGRAIGTTLIINDNDGQGRKGWLGFGAGVGEEKNPARFRTLILSERVAGK